MTTKTMMRKALAALAFLAGPAAGATCTETTFEGVDFTLCEARADQDLRLFHSDASGALLGSFGAVNDMLAPEGKQLAFAMNAGMYHPDRAPVGLYVENGVQRHDIVLPASKGNFGLLPNGVFCIGEGRLAVIESHAYAAAPPACRFATQSGPMLVIDGALHPRFLPDSTSTYIRNGVGVSADGQTAWFVISDRPVTFHRFARFFRDSLGAPNALYFDGSISRLFVPAQGRADFGLPLGPMVGLVARD